MEVLCRKRKVSTEIGLDLEDEFHVFSSSWGAAGLLPSQEVWLLVYYLHRRYGCWFTTFTGGMAAGLLPSQEVWLLEVFWRWKYFGAEISRNHSLGNYEAAKVSFSVWSIQGHRVIKGVVHSRAQSNQGCGPFKGTENQGCGPFKGTE